MKTSYHGYPIPPYPCVAEKHIIFEYQNALYCVPHVILVQYDLIAQIFRLQSVSEYGREMFYSQSLTMESLTDIVDCIGKNKQEFQSLLNTCKLETEAQKTVAATTA